MLSKHDMEQLAEKILLWGTEDIEFLTVWEVMDDQYRDEEWYKSLTDEEQHELALKIDKLIRSALVTIEFPEE